MEIKNYARRHRDAVIDAALYTILVGAACLVVTGLFNEFTRFLTSCH